jgi:uncharacterized SAM-binding protein YcdF (DUF218 family)
MKKIAFSLLFLFSLWFSALLYFISIIPSKDFVYEAKYQADAIVILTGDNNRIEQGLELFKNSSIQYLLISGVAQESNLKQIVQNFVHKQDYLKNSDSIDLGKEATSTVGNLRETQEWIGKKKLKSIILVTSNYHMPRSYALFKGKLKIDRIEIYPTFSEKFDKIGWWYNSKSIELIILEFHKYLACKIALLF